MRNLYVCRETLEKWNSSASASVCVYLISLPTRIRPEFKDTKRGPNRKLLWQTHEDSLVHLFGKLSHVPRIIYFSTSVVQAELKTSGGPSHRFSFTATRLWTGTLQFCFGHKGTGPEPGPIKKCGTGRTLVPTSGAGRCNASRPDAL